MRGEQIGGPTPDKYALRHRPDGIYCVDGRVIPSANNASRSVDDRDLVVGITGGVDDVKRFRGGVLGVDIEQG